MNPKPTPDSSLLRCIVPLWTDIRRHRLPIAVAVIISSLLNRLGLMFTFLCLGGAALWLAICQGWRISLTRPENSPSQTKDINSL